MNDNGSRDRGLAMALATFATLNELVAVLTELGLMIEEEHASIRARAKAALLEIGKDGHLSPHILADAIAAVDTFMRARQHPGAAR